MIKLENVVLASPEQMEFIIEGMRNPMNSWEKSDSECVTAGYDIVGFDLGESDHSLMQRLAKAGTDHRKFMRMMPVYVRITAPLYWWEEFDTYGVGTVPNSCSTMHKIAEKEFTLDDFSHERLKTDRDFMMYAPTGYRYSAKDLLALVVETLNNYRKEYLETKSKDAWWQMIQLLPSSYNQTRNVMLNYEALANIYRQQKSYKLDEWRAVCKWIETLPYSELTTEEDSK